MSIVFDDLLKIHSFSNRNEALLVLIRVVNIGMRASERACCWNDGVVWMKVAPPPSSMYLLHNYMIGMRNKTTRSQAEAVHTITLISMYYAGEARRKLCAQGWFNKSNISYKRDGVDGFGQMLYRHIYYSPKHTHGAELSSSIVAPVQNEPVIWMVKTRGGLRVKSRSKLIWDQLSFVVDHHSNPRSLGKNVEERETKRNCKVRKTTKVYLD